MRMPGGSSLVRPSTPHTGYESHNPSPRPEAHAVSSRGRAVGGLVLPERGGRGAAFLWAAVLLVPFLLTLGSSAWAQGLSSRYPSDLGIEKDPAVVFFESFEGIAGVDDLRERWESISTPEIMSVGRRVPPGSSGDQSLLLRHVGGESTGGSLYRRFLPGYEHLYVRFYVRFAEDIAPVHHFVFFGGFNPTTPYAQGTAGKMPDGTDFLSTAAEPGGESGRWTTYTYWPGMSGAPPEGVGYGVNFLGDKGPPVKQGAWTCVELMIKLNTIGERDGEMAVWIDGEEAVYAAPGRLSGVFTFGTFRPGEGGKGIRWPRGADAGESYVAPDGGDPFPGFEWRTTKDLNVNYLWLLAYISGAEKGHVSNIWFDNIVVATEYIGPIRPSQ